ncbi:hypothetical protein M231_03459 [Tremella mesenterica]|uniref:Uncharacterized protein n=1 Tax=Tremella mesenterica TaxID=5217 RepID=A0A4Q1BN15_TREME|nr:hypothetical protein M231_03459 [Tremella mesenterica]
MSEHSEGETPQNVPKKYTAFGQLQEQENMRSLFGRSSATKQDRIVHDQTVKAQTEEIVGSQFDPWSQNIFGYRSNSNQQLSNVQQGSTISGYPYGNLSSAPTGVGNRYGVMAPMSNSKITASYMESLQKMQAAHGQIPPANLSTLQSNQGSQSRVIPDMLSAPTLEPFGSSPDLTTAYSLNAPNPDPSQERESMNSVEPYPNQLGVDSIPPTLSWEMISKFNSRIDELPYDTELPCLLPATETRKFYDALTCTEVGCTEPFNPTDTVLISLVKESWHGEHPTRKLRHGFHVDQETRDRLRDSPPYHALSSWVSIIGTKVRYYATVTIGVDLLSRSGSCLKPGTAPPKTPNHRVIVGPDAY